MVLLPELGRQEGLFGGGGFLESCKGNCTAGRKRILQSHQIFSVIAVLY